jgi:hypothetical protein
VNLTPAQGTANGPAMKMIYMTLSATAALMIGFIIALLKSGGTGV